MDYDIWGTSGEFAIVGSSKGGSPKAGASRVAGVGYWQKTESGAVWVEGDPPAAYPVETWHTDPEENPFSYVGDLWTDEGLLGLTWGEALTTAATTWASIATANVLGIATADYITETVGIAPGGAIESFARAGVEGLEAIGALGLQEIAPDDSALESFFGTTAWTLGARAALSTLQGLARLGSGLERAMQATAPYIGGAPSGDPSHFAPFNPGMDIHLDPSTNLYMGTPRTAIEYVDESTDWEWFMDIYN